jgi:hypothetical protein
MSETFIPVTERALMARINRKLAHNVPPQRVSCWRVGSRGHHQWGRYGVIDISRNALVDATDNLQGLASDHGVIAENERLVE